METSLGYLILPTTSVLEWKLEIRRLGSNLGAAIEKLCALEQISTSLGLLLPRCLYVNAARCGSG